MLIQKTIQKQFINIHDIEQKVKEKIFRKKKKTISVSCFLWLENLEFMAQGAVPKQDYSSRLFL